MKRSIVKPNETALHAPPSKQAKTDNEDDINEFNEDWDADINFDEDGVNNAEVTSAELPTETTEFQKWLRPKLVAIDARCDNIIFQQFDIDHYEVNDITQSMPVFRLFGVNKDGNSVLAHVNSFHPYFYVKLDKVFTSYELNLVRELLIKGISNQPQHRHTYNPVISVEICFKTDIYGYSKDQKSTFMKITVALPKLIPGCKRILEEGMVIGNSTQYFNLFDNNIDFSIRYMVDSQLVGCSWVELPAGAYTIRNINKTSLCQLEVDINWNKIIYHKAENEWSDIAPIRILSFDIECAGRKGIFPDPKIDRVIQISNIISRYGETEPFIKNIFTLDTCAPIAGSHVVSYQTEQELLEHWAMFIREVDPDIITGYNIQNFDLPYLINRATTLNVKGFFFLGRIKGTMSKITDTQINSKQMGRRDNKMVHMIGRIQFDLFQILLREHKLRSYSLNSVSNHFLGEHKEDVPYQIIADLQNGDQFTRQRLAIYCLKDSELVLRLLNKLMCIINHIEMARVTGVPLSYLLSRGQQIKVLSQLLRKAAVHDYVLPDNKSAVGDEFTGAIVLEPKKGFYTKPIATLDFSSLYPSIMMAHNLCYTTLIMHQSQIQSLGLSSDDYIKTPVGALFVKSSVKKGLLPEILQDLIEARKKAKRELALETDPFKKQVLDGRQLALKVSANSVYGFTGAQVGRLPCLDISSSVTGYGRVMIERTKLLVEERFTIANGYAHNADVIYGDTDSVMCRFGVDTVAEAMLLGKEAAEYISLDFEKPIKLEFEKVYYPYLLINKKRYAGMYYTRPDKYDKMDCKGLETVRRDNCLLVSNLLNTCLEKLLIDRDASSSMAYAQSVIADLLCNRVDIFQLIISKELTKTDEQYSNAQAHSVLAKKMAARDSGSAPQLGDRVPYVVIAGRDKNIATRAEDPIYVLDHDIPIDTNYYLNNQIMNPLLRLFEPIYGEEKAKDKLTKGNHMKSKSIQRSNVGPLSRFTTVKETCVHCRNVLTTTEKSLCMNCWPISHNILMKENGKLLKLQVEYTKLFRECHPSLDSLFRKVECTSRDCPTFYKRKKAHKDLVRQDEIFKKLSKDLDW